MWWVGKHEMLFLHCVDFCLPVFHLLNEGRNAYSLLQGYAHVLGIRQSWFNPHPQVT